MDRPLMSILVRRRPVLRLPFQQQCITARWPERTFFGLTENAGHEIAGQNSVRPALHYYEVCSCLLLFS